jgi:hypothetical protein
MRHTWKWTFDLPPDEQWPLLADTNRFNEAMGLPHAHRRDRGRDKAAGLSLQYEKRFPVTVAGRAHRNISVYSSGQISRSSSASRAPPLMICWRCMFSSFVR